MLVVHVVGCTERAHGPSKLGPIVAPKCSGDSKGAKHVLFEGVGYRGASLVRYSSKDAEFGKTADGGQDV